LIQIKGTKKGKGRKKITLIEVIKKEARVYQNTDSPKS